MRNARAHKLQWSGPTVHSSTVAIRYQHALMISKKDCMQTRGKFLPFLHGFGAQSSIFSSQVLPR